MNCLQNDGPFGSMSIRKGETYCPSHNFLVLIFGEGVEMSNGWRRWFILLKPQTDKTPLGNEYQKKAENF